MGESVNAHLPEYSTLKSFGILFSRTFRAGMLFFNGGKNSGGRRGSVRDHMKALFLPKADQVQMLQL